MLFLFLFVIFLCLCALSFVSYVLYKQNEILKKQLQETQKMRIENIINNSTTSMPRPNRIPYTYKERQD